MKVKAYYYFFAFLIFLTVRFFATGFFALTDFFTTFFTVFFTFFTGFFVTFFFVFVATMNISPPFNRCLCFITYTFNMRRIKSEIQ